MLAQRVRVGHMAALIMLRLSHSWIIVIFVDVLLLPLVPLVARGRALLPRDTGVLRVRALLIAIA